MLSRFRPFSGPLLPLVLALGLAGCQGIYDDTKGWANRLEASVIKAAEDFGNNISQEQSKAPSGVEWVGEERPTTATTNEPQGLVEEAAAAMATPEEASAEADTDIEAMAPEPANPAAPPPPLQQTAEAMDPTGPAAEASPASPPLPKLKPAKAAETTPKAIEDSAKKTATSKPPMVIHLSSLRSEKAAQKEWEALKRAFPEQLSAMSPRFARTEIAKRGTFYRVLAGPIPTKQAAKEVCGALKAKKQYCQVMSAPPSA